MVSEHLYVDSEMYQWNRMVWDASDGAEMTLA
jgi:hypothetical protein